MLDTLRKPVQMFWFRMAPRLAGTAVFLLSAGLAQTRVLDRPRWMDEPGIVMAGNCEEPSFRARRMGRLDYTLPPEKVVGYEREHNQEMMKRARWQGMSR